MRLQEKLYDEVIDLNDKQLDVALYEMMGVAFAAISLKDRLFKEQAYVDIKLGQFRDNYI